MERLSRRRAGGTVFPGISSWMAAAGLIVLGPLRRPTTRRRTMTPTTLRLDRLETRLAPAVATWDGGGADNKWTTAANWVGDVAPKAGDDVDFPGGVAQKTA